MAADGLNWILPVSAAIQAIATVVLVIVTVRYVRLTRQIVETGRQQLSDARAILEAQTGVGRATLLALAKRLLDTLEPLPNQGIPPEQLRRAAMWSQSEEQRLFDLATALGSPFAGKAPETVAGLAWVRQLHGRITRDSETIGYGSNSKEELAYTENRGRALNGLRSIVQVLE
jgi:hypothetical protein